MAFIYDSRYRTQEQSFWIRSKLPITMTSSRCYRNKKKTWQHLLFCAIRHCKSILTGFPGKGHICKKVATGPYLLVYLQNSFFSRILFHAVKDCNLLPQDKRRFYISPVFAEQIISLSLEKLWHAECQDQAKKPKCKSQFIPIISNGTAEIAVFSVRV